MATLIGTDEAGYGPNFGPLVISASRWSIPGDAEIDLYPLLQRAISSRVDETERIPVADSKLLYKPRGPLSHLERGVFSALRVTGKSADRWRQVWQLLAPTAVRDLEALPWYVDFDMPVPVDCAADEIERLGERLASTLNEEGSQLQRLESIALFPARFNQQVTAEGSKGAALSAATLRLVRRMVDASPAEPIFVQCDKHGGRNRYASLLQQQFPEYLVEVKHEGRASSAYAWGPKNRRVEFRFVAKGESFLPAALASMASKYLRELAMRAFNAFWVGHLPDLKPTAGYPVDAARFRGQIRGLQSRLGIADRLLWRDR